MNKKNYSNWPLGLAVIVLLIAVPFAYLTRPTQPPRVQPTTGLPLKTAHVDHHDIVKGPFKTGQEEPRIILQLKRDKGGGGCG